MFQNTAKEFREICENSKKPFAGGKIKLGK
jgi:hypothetical protein